MWSDATSCGYEVRKCRNRVVQYLHGTVLDIGCGDEKIIPQAIGVDLDPKADLRVDLSRPDALSLFNNDSVDVIFSSHFLEHIIDYEGALRQFWRILKPNGLLILYLPHRDLYPRIGEEGANPDHKHDFVPEDILNALSKFARYTVIRNQTHDEADEYSFELVISKDLQARPEEDTRDKLLLIRYGAMGDLITITPVIRLLAQKHKVIVNTVPGSADILWHNPYVHELRVQQAGAIPNDQLGDYEAQIRSSYAKIVTLHESIERTLLLEERDPEYHLPKEERHRLCNINYYDHTLNRAGLNAYGLRPEIYLSHHEQFMGELFRRTHRGFFLIQWQVTGSAAHKIYPYTELITDALLERYPDIKIFLTGGGEFKVDVSQWNKRLVNKVGWWNHRQACVMTKFMDLVVSPETGVLNASGAFDTPKIGILTHSSRENLTKYFLNDYSLESQAPCAPCHRMIHGINQCPVDANYGLPICMSLGHPPHRILSIIEKLYREWKERGEEVQA